MQQIKIFKSTEYKVDKLEAKINDWLKASNAKIISMSGNIAPQTGGPENSSTNQEFQPSDILVMLLYETT